MKLNKLLVTTLLALSMGATACGGEVVPPAESSVESTGGEGTSQESSQAESSESSTSVAPVSRIKVNAPSSVLVEEEFNLDDYVEVTGGEGPKVFTVEIPKAYQGKVTVDGHKATALVEGTIKLTIKAGSKSASFSTTAMTVLKAKYNEMCGKLGYNFNLLELTVDETTQETNLDVAVVHRPDYSYFNMWAGDDEDESIVYPGGFLKCQNGKTYEYYFDKEDELVVDPEIYSDFGNYYCNFPWHLSTTDFVTRTITPEEGEPYEALVLERDVQGDWNRPEIFGNKVGEFMYTCARVAPDGYEFGDLIVSEMELLDDENQAVETFLFEVEYYKSATSTKEEEYVGSDFFVLYVDEEFEITDVRSYIDEGHNPEPTSFKEVSDKIAAIANEKQAYTANVKAGWFDGESDEEIALPEDTGYFTDSIGDQFPVGTEVDYVNDKASYQAVNLGGEGVNPIYGSIETEDGLFSYSNYDSSTESFGETLTATAYEKGTDLWADTIDTLGKLNSEDVWDKFAAIKRVDEEGSVTIVTDGKNAGEAFMAYAMVNSYLGYLAYSQAFFAYTLGDDQVPMYEYVDVYITVTSTTLEIEFIFDFSEFYYSLDVVYSAFGENNVPDLSGIVFPTAE
jgi:hypothetical protein